MGMYHSKAKKGFSLVELIVAISVLIIVMAVTSVVASRMMEASASQRRMANRHVYEDHARQALLSVLRDARISDRALTVAPDLLVLRAYRPGATSGTTNTVTITYTRTGGLLERAITGTLPIVEGPLPHDWPNPFVPARIDAFRPESVNPPDNTRLDVELILDLPLMPGEEAVPGDGAIAGHRRWTVNSAVTIARIPG